MSRLVPAASLDGWGWLEAGIVSGDLRVPGDHARSWLFGTIKADRDGPATHRLLALANDGRVLVRRAVFELIAESCSLHAGWPLVADAAEPALRDDDPLLRRVAAALLVRTGGADRAVAALSASSDPVVRIALLRAIAWRDVPPCRALLDRLRSAQEPAVRLLATVAEYRSDEPEAWPALDAAVLADLEAADEGLGEVWARTLADLDREDDCCASAVRLTRSRPELDGVRLAAVAMRTWRAAPRRLAPALTGLLEKGPSAVRSAALHALASSLTASRLGADALAAVLDDPELGATAAIALGCAGDHRAVPHLVRLMLAGSDEPRLAEAFRAVARAGADPEAPVAAARQLLAELPMRVLAAFGAAAAVPDLIARLEGAENDTPDLTFHVLAAIGPGAAAAVPHLRQYNTVGALPALLSITSDRAVADQYLSGRPEELRRGRLASQLLTWLAEHGGLTGRQHRQLRSLFGVPGTAQVEVAGALWRHEGPAVAEELLAVLPRHCFDERLGLEALRVLAAMGAHARPVLDWLDRLIAAPRRAGFDLGDEDAEMRADEVLLAAAITARERITG
ncbi:hypothetical protein [Dactylosporangium sp. CS-033363]|uniref:hypothetical protein n=1 Tax=Dactylosporangium sp. CS-033363 TaxID=3239935 RepID=UPI003D8F8044